MTDMENDPTPPQGIPRPQLATFDDVALRFDEFGEALDERWHELRRYVDEAHLHLEELRIAVANLNAMVDGHHHDIEQMDRRLRGSEPQMTPDRMIELSDVIFNAAEVLTASIPLGTREQWSAADCLRTSATHLWSAAQWLLRHEDKT